MKIVSFRKALDMFDDLTGVPDKIDGNELTFENFI